MQFSAENWCIFGQKLKNENKNIASAGNEKAETVKIVIFGAEDENENEKEFRSVFN